MKQVLHTPKELPLHTRDPTTLKKALQKSLIHQPSTITTHKRPYNTQKSPTKEPCIQ